MYVDVCICVVCNIAACPMILQCFATEHYSTVTIELVQEEDCTKLHLTQTGVPESDYERTQEGWTRYYWESIKAIFGFGARLF